MAPKRKIRARQAQLAFDALAIEGGLLSPEWLSKVAQLQAGSQSESDYRVPKGLNLRDEIGRYWRIAQAHWTDFAQGRNANADGKALAERFVTSLLRESFGFASLAAIEPIVIADRGYPIGHAALGGRVPVVIAPADAGFDDPSPEFGDGSRRRSAFGLTQEFLNAHDGTLWGVTSDGDRLRIGRDNASLTRPAWIEADLARIFIEERYADFAALWLLVHETRFGREGQPATECVLENWRNAGREEGTRAREDLRRGVEEALIALGQGFLFHPENQPLRASLQNGTLTTRDYFNELLRLVYRFIFLLTVEERGLLHPDGTDEAAKQLYADGYSLRRLRERSVKRSAHDRFSDLWEATKIVFRGLAAAEPRLGLPALAGLFAPAQCPTLDAARLENRALLLAVFRLAWLRDNGALARVNWRDMGPEELGSVYESLLELVPQMTQAGRQFEFASGAETKGHVRKTTGSYYTPDALVQVLLDSALEQVVAETIAKNLRDPIDALLRLSIVDPACGSGHFLLAAARRLASHVARLQASGTPSAAEYRHALRQVVGRCVYGVDLNPMAVELCKLSLWMEAVEPGLPLTFLNSHIQHGNAFLGTTPELMAKGIPDDAWNPIEGDDKKIASALKKRNKAEATGQRTLQFDSRSLSEIEHEAVVRAVVQLEQTSDATVDALAQKESRWDEILTSKGYQHQRFVADAWCASFVWPKQSGEPDHAAPTNDVWRQLRNGERQPDAVTLTIVSDVATQYSFFHWYLQFPQVFAKGGFDLVIGNPPWDRIQLEEQQFFASTHPEIAGADDARRRKRLILDLQGEDPAAFFRYRAALRRTLGMAHIVKESGRFPLSSKGNVATQSLFVELALAILASEPARSFGLIVPSGLATQDTQKDLFAFLMNGRLRAFYDFENSDGQFGDVHRSFRFALVVATSSSSLEPARFSFFLRKVADLTEPGRVLGIDSSYLAEVSPNTRSAPLARTQRDLDVLLGLCKSGVALKLDVGLSPWGWQSSQVFNNTHEAALLVSVAPTPMEEVPINLIRLYEAKQLFQFDHRYSTWEGGDTRYVTPAERDDPSFLIHTRWHVPREVWNERVAPRNNHRRWAIGFRRISHAGNERTFIAAALPVCGTGTQTPIATVTVNPRLTALLLGNLNSFVFDFGARLRSGGTDLNHFIVNQLFVVPPGRYQEPRWRDVSEQIVRIVLELTFTAWDLDGFARDLGYEGQPFRWMSERRFLLRCELDAAFFHLYNVSRDDTEYVMDTFLRVRKNDEKEHGEYRTKRVVLEIYDTMAEAARARQPYQTLLDPPPADPRVAHRSRGGQVIAFPAPAGLSVPLPPPAPDRQLPAWSPELLPAVAVTIGLSLSGGSWATSLSGLDLGTTALAAVLRNVRGPSPREDVERAVVLAVLPGLLQTKFDMQTAGTWRQVIGAANMALTSIAAVAIPWKDVVQRAHIEGVLDIGPDGRWSAGPDVQDAPSRELDARAIVSLSWLANVGAEDQELTTQLGVLRAG